MSMPDKTVCEKHYIHAKKWAANSAIRASLKKGKRRKVVDGDVYTDGRKMKWIRQQKTKRLKNTHCLVQRTSVGKYRIESFLTPLNHHLGGVLEILQRTIMKQSSQSLQIIKGLVHGDMPLVAMDKFMSNSKNNDDSDEMEEYSYGSTDSANESEEQEQPCHQCLRYDKILWCLTCDRRGYCGSCISSWYSDIPLEEIQKACPACRGSCVCSSCRHMERLIKARIRKVPAQEKLEDLYSLSVLPIIKKIHHQQTFEVDLEQRLRGTYVNLARAKLSADEQMCCNFCRTPIIDYYRHCENCSYDLCLNCCKDLREASNGRGQDRESTAQPLIKSNIFKKLHKWNAIRDGSIPCPQRECVGCSSLVLCQTFKMNWVAKLVKNAEEIVTGCNVADVDYLENKDATDSAFCKAAMSEDNDDSSLCSPTSVDMQTMGFNIFRKYWLKGQPVILRQVFNNSISSWDPVNICRSMLEMTNEKIDENMQVKSVDCLDASKTEIDVDQFIKGYSEGIIGDNGRLQVLKWTVSAAPSIFEEFLSHQNPEIISRLPFLEYIHPRWGLLNVAAKLPQYSLQTDMGFRILISYGAYEKLGEGESVPKLVDGDYLAAALSGFIYFSFCDYGYLV